MSIPLPTIRQLRYLIAVHEEGHFSRAAEKCFVTQSTLSAGVQELETILGTQLIERTKRSVRFTDVGEQLVARARQVVSMVEDMRDLAMAHDEPLTGLLRLGAIPTIGPYLLPRILPPLRDSYPHLKLFLKELQTADLIEQIKAGELDVGLMALPYPMEGLESVTLSDDRFVMAAHRDHPLAAESLVSPDAIPAEELLLLEEGHCLRAHALDACTFSATSVQSTNAQGTSLFTLTELVASGFGVTLVPEIAVEAGALNNPQIALCPVAGDVGRQLALVWRPASARTAEFRLLADFMRAQIEHVEPKIAMKSEGLIENRASLSA